MLAWSKETILCFFFCSVPLSEAWLKIFLTWLALQNRSVRTRAPAPTFKCIMSRSLLSIRTLGKSLFIIHHYVLHMVNSFLVWPTSFLCIQQNPKLTFSLKVLPSEGRGAECEGERARGECISKRSSHLSAQAANSWWRRCKMSEQRLTRWKMTGNRFPSLFTPPAREEVDHQSAVMSHSLQMLALL